MSLILFTNMLSASPMVLESLTRSWNPSFVGGNGLSLSRGLESQRPHCQIGELLEEVHEVHSSFPLGSTFHSEERPLCPMNQSSVEVCSCSVSNCLPCSGMNQSSLLLVSLRMYGRSMSPTIGYEMPFWGEGITPHSAVPPKHLCQ